ncbi:ArsR/SmtB family transcription factor [Rhizomonospora bruguierae]|uniref:ArsR/SmtB family transcription factor n=1 Tax=Rhizomonospora bruguierae TaxID=1581705 RepID=UPI001BCE5CA7|nr:winged helix-turn-helix domain-containing protein [Micromonospora sp. NBRC 107566]
MLRIVFTGDDLARTRVAAAPDPVWELILSLHQLQGRSRDPIAAGWRREVTGRLRRDQLLGPFRLLFALNPPRGYFPDFLTPAASREGFEAGLEAVRSTPTRLVRRDLSVLVAQNPPGGPLHGTLATGEATALVRGGAQALRDLTDSMTRYRRVAVDPYWTRMLAAVEADRRRRARAVLDGGVEGLLTSFPPQMLWVPGGGAGVLEVPGYPSSRELHLNGRGLLLVPSFFCNPVPVALLDPELPPVLVYPVDRLGGALDRPATDQPAVALAALLGRTRAAVLAVVGEGCSTGELARRLHISPAAASQHATVLRNAGLLSTQRDRNTVLHTLTPLGRAILEAS